jgi:hypothetical protein
MLNERLHATRQVRAELVPAEEAADESYLSALKLGVALCEARRSARLSIHTAQEGFAEIHAAISHAGLARARLLNAHRLLADVERDILPGVPARMMGDVCPWPSAMAEGSVTPLAAVG